MEAARVSQDWGGEITCEWSTAVGRGKDLGWGTFFVNSTDPVSAEFCFSISFLLSVSPFPRPYVNWRLVEEISLCVLEVPLLISRILWDANTRWTSGRISWDSDTQWLCLYKGWRLDFSSHIKLSANSRNSLLLEASTTFPVFSAYFPTRMSSLSLMFLSAEPRGVLLGTWAWTCSCVVSAKPLPSEVFISVNFSFSVYFSN